MKQKRKYKWLNTYNGKWVLGALLVLAFPVGLYVMWTESNLSRRVKIAVSAAWCAVIITAAAVMMAGPWKYDESADPVYAVSSNGEMLAPLPPDELVESAQLLKKVSEESSLISEPTPTPVPTRVYCNDNGKYYHLAGCRYVYSTTPKVTLNQAKNAGKTACPLCNPPKEETYEN